MIVYKFKGFTLCQTDTWQYTILGEDNKVVSKGLSSQPFTKEEAERVIKYAIIKPEDQDDRANKKLPTFTFRSGSVGRADKDA